MKLLFAAITYSILLVNTATAKEHAKAKLIDVQRIWDKATHNGFTDLIRFKNRWYCTFREGQSHVSNEGVLKVISSEDGKKWEEAAVFNSLRGYDMREAKFSIMPDGRLMLLGVEANRQKTPPQHQSLVWFTQDGTNWSEQIEVADTDFWLWRGNWHNGKGIFIGYGCRKDNHFLRLYTTSDGINYDTLIDKVEVAGDYPNETSLLFLPSDACYCLLRQDGQTKSGYIGKSYPPYTDWDWKDLGVRIGGPNMTQLPDGKFVAVARRYGDSSLSDCTMLYWLDPEKGKLVEALELPSGGDTSYAGLVWYDDLLWVSYYSSHEEKTAVYLAKIQFEHE
jgi:hypothetical protein